MIPLPSLLYASPGGLEGAARYAARAIVSGAWEGLLLAAGTALLLRLVPGTTARLRFAVWTMVFAVLAFLPLISGTHSGLVGVTVAAVPVLRLDPRWSYALSALWVVAGLLRLGHLALQAIRLRRLWHSAVPVRCEAPVALELQPGKVEICTSAEIDRPSVIGFLAPRILIPAWLFDQLTQDELRQIVLHEMEHLRRRDDWINLVQKLGLVLFPLNPALVWIDRRLAAEREFACDDGVLSRTQAPRAYATCLTSLAERRMAHRQHGRLTALALGALGVIRRSDFSRRIDSILGRRPGLSPAMRRVFAVLCAAGVLCAGGALARAPELVAFAPEIQPQRAASAFPEAARPAATGATRAARMEPVVFHPSTREVKADWVEGKQALRKSVRPSSAGRPRKSPAELVAQTDVVTDPIAQFEQMTRFEQTVQRQARIAQQIVQPQLNPRERLLVLTEGQESEPVPVIVTLPDGRTFFATYTATPTQAGWIVFQL